MKPRWRYEIPLLISPDINTQNFQSIDKWKQFFKNSDKYSYVGKVIHHPIDPKSPIPEHCEPEKRKPKASTQGAANKGRTEL
jgi:hypothetical protein